MTGIKTRIAALQEERASAWEQAKSILDAAEGRSLTVEERTGYDQINADLDAKDAEIRSLVETDKRNSSADAIRSEYAKFIAPDGSNKTEDSFEKDFRSFLRGDLRALDVVRDKPLTHLERREMSGPGAETRTLSRLTAAAGQNTVKTSFYDQLVQNLIVNAALLNAGPTVVSTESGEQIQIPKTLTHSTGALFAEAATITNSDPTFGQITLGAYKYGALVQVSRELIDDSSVDLLGYLAMEMGRAVGNAAGADFIIGNGTSKPRGITLDTTLGVTGGLGVTGAFTADNLIDLFYSVAPVYRQSASANWMLQDITLGAVRKLKDTTNRYLWEPSLVPGVPDTLLGKGIVTDPNFAATGLAAKSVIFGDISRYFVREVAGVRMEQSNDFAFSSDLVTFKAVWRADGALVDLTGAVKHFLGGAS
ncbi:phage major capsid protein [Acidothermaceae bacterium B102]|nr:phage major capsid protein [Acidothermaceae bacterium B102]